MDIQKVKSLLFFLILTALFFYFGHTIAREPGSSIVHSEQSTRFLDVIAVLDNIQFDFDFISSLSDTSIKTEVYVPPLSPSDSSRDNPFMRSSVSSSFSGLSGLPITVAAPADSGAVREEVSGPLPEDVIQQPLDGVVPPQDSALVFPDDFPREQQGDQPAPPPSPSSSSSATLTR